MKKLSVLVLLFVPFLLMAQKGAPVDSVAIEKLRTQSGVDPTRVSTRVGYSIKYYLQDHGKSEVSNALAAVFGINRWSFALKTDIVTNNHNLDGTFATGFSDLKFSVLNAFFIKGKVALAGSVEFAVPLGTMNSGYFSATPAVTLSYTINPTLFFAIQPQYSFAFAKAQLPDSLGKYPALNVLTFRIFLAKFTKSGWFFVIEPRPIVNFTNKEFDLIISPIIGKALGKGFNLIFLSEIPTNFKTQLGKKGVLFQFGFNKNF